MKTTRSSRYLELLSKEIEESCTEAGIDPKYGPELIDGFFKRLRDIFEDPRVPTVNIPGFGTFRPHFFRLSSIIGRKIAFFKKGNYPRYILEATFKRLWPIYKREQDQKYGKNNKERSNKWNNIDPKELSDNIYVGIKTDLPKNYYTMSEPEWFIWFCKEARFDTQSPVNVYTAVVYNTGLKRKKIDGTYNDEEFIEIKKGRQGRPTHKTSELLQKAREYVYKEPNLRKEYKY